MSNEIQVVPDAPPMTIAEMKNHFNLVLQAQKEVMVDGEDYGVIQGTKKPTLLKAGAEKLNLLFRLDPQYEITEAYEPAEIGKHYTVVSKCTLYHAPTGRRLGSGYGSCSTKEKKYAYRDSKKKCPTCGNETIIKGRQEYGGGWLCFEKKGGCGSKFKDGDSIIEDQKTGQEANPELPDLYNTILKMANKRSLVAASLNVTGASAIFTQDLEDGERQYIPTGEAKAETKVEPAKKDPATAKNVTPQPAKPVTTSQAEPSKAFDLTEVKLELDKAQTLAEANAVIKPIAEKNRSIELMEYYAVTIKKIKQGVEA